MIVKFFYEGGPTFMSVVYLMWIIVFVLAVRFIILYLGNKQPKKLKRTNDSILFFGSLAFLIGITGQMMGLIGAFDAVLCLGNEPISPDMLAGGLKVTFIVPLFGLVLLILSSIIWFVFRNLKNYPSQTEPEDQ
jgi:uncharacterized membrane protein YfcA